jgi:CheY-like chemotaxis protein
MPDGGVLALETVFVPEPDGPGTVQLIVRDTGTGMAPDVLSRACEPFFSTKDEGKGTGLGLSLVREIVEQFGGALELRSTPGSGTQAVVTLNAVKAEEIIPEPIVDASTPGGYETILLVEDDASVREIVLEFLRDAAYYVLEARDAAEAQAIMRKEARPVDLLVTDIVLPGMSGPEMAGVLRELSPHMRTLFISGYPSESVGGTRSPSFLAKPFSRAALLQAVRRALNAPRFREIDAPETPGRLVNREPDVAKGTKRNGSH